MKISNKIDRNKIYEEELNPLINELSKKCVEHKISMLCSVHMPKEDNDNYYEHASVTGPETPDRFKYLISWLQGHSEYKKVIKNAQ